SCVSASRISGRRACGKPSRRTNTASGPTSILRSHIHAGVRRRRNSSAPARAGRRSCSTAMANMSPTPTRALQKKACGQADVPLRTVSAGAGHTGVRALRPAVDPCYATIMTRTEAIELLTARLADLPDERIEALAELADAYSRPTFFSTMTSDQKAELAQSI